MKKEFLKYFKTIGIREPILKRIERIFEYCRRLVPDEEFIAVSVNEYLESDGTKRYQSIRFYSEKRSVVARDFVNDNDIVVGALDRNYESATVKAENYDFKKATGQSRLAISADYVGEERHVTLLKGSGENCDYLMEIYHKFIYPRLKKP